MAELNLNRAEFVKSAAAPEAFIRDTLPRVVFAGKSNVGKSSVINRLCGQRGLARVSGEPGKTRLINLYALNGGELVLCDLPGYGFARVAQGEKQRWAAMIEGYLSGSACLKRVFQLVDIRHEPTQDDQLMVQYLRHYGLPFTVLANKCDKLSKAQRARAQQLICRTLAVQPWEVIPFSALTGEGTDRVLELLDALTQPPTPPEGIPQAAPEGSPQER